MAVVDDIDLATRRDEHGLQRRLGHPEHRVEDDVQVGVPDGLDVEALEDGVQVPVDRRLDRDQRRFTNLFRRNGFHVGFRECVALLGECVRHGELRVAATFCEHLETVVERRVVRGGDREPVRRVQVANGPHAHGRRHRTTDDRHRDVVRDEHFDGPPGCDVGEESPVVADDEPTLADTFPVHAVAQPLSEQTDIRAGETVTDDGAPPASAELDHVVTPSIPIRRR